MTPPLDRYAGSIRLAEVDGGAGLQEVRETEVMELRITLRPVEQSELPEVTRIYTDPTWPGEYQWFGFRPAKAREVERRWAEDGLIGGPVSILAVALEDGTCVGVVSWRPVGETGNLEIGIWVHPEHRGRRIGTEAQRQLVDYLFATTPVHRLQAGTEVDNVPEQRALERVGFQREGVLRGYGFRDGRWRDGVMYGLLRDDPCDSSSSSGAAHSACVMCDRESLRSAAEVYVENDHFVYASSRDPATPPDVLPGSGIAVPVDHRASAFDFTNAEWTALGDVLRRAKHEWDERLAPDGYGLCWTSFPRAESQLAGMHAHLHVVPRFDDEPKADGGGRVGIKGDDNRRPDPLARGGGGARLFGA